MKVVFDWLYYCFYCLAFAKGMKYERGAFAMNITGGFYLSALLILIISKLQILQFPTLRVILFFALTIVIFYIQDYFLIKKRRYRFAIDRFLNTPKFLKVIYGLFAMFLMLSNFFVIMIAVGLSAK